jgi:hypothetical protein
MFALVHHRAYTGLPETGRLFQKFDGVSKKTIECFQKSFRNYQLIIQGQKIREEYYKKNPPPTGGVIRIQDLHQTTLRMSKIYEIPLGLKCNDLCVIFYYNLLKHNGQLDVLQKNDTDIIETFKQIARESLPSPNQNPLMIATLVHSDVFFKRHIPYLRAIYKEGLYGFNSILLRVVEEQYFKTFIRWKERVQLEHTQSRQESKSSE